MALMRVLALADRPFHADVAKLASRCDVEAIVTLGDLQPSWLCRKLPAADVLLCHCPPRGVNDDPEDPAHIGYDALREWVLKHQPRWLLHGHTHPTPGSLLKSIGETRVVYVNGARVIDLS